MLSLPFVQTKIAQYFTESINDDFGTDINIERIAISPFGHIKIHGILIKDHRQDTLFYVNKLNTNAIGIKKAIDGDIILGDITLDGFLFHMKIYKNEKESNLTKFVNLFDDGTPSSGNFLLTARSIKLTQSSFSSYDYNRSETPLDAKFTAISGLVDDFKIKGSDVTTQINQLSFLDYRGLSVTNLSADFEYTKSHIFLNQLEVKTNKSYLLGQIHLLYDNNGFSNFNNNVVFKGFISKSELSSDDIRFFYDGLGENLYFKLNADIQGPLNNLWFKNLIFSNDSQTNIIGKVLLKNSFDGKNDTFELLGDFQNFRTNHYDLVTLLPDLLEAKLPDEVKKFDIISMNGKTSLTTQKLHAQVQIFSKLGEISTDLYINKYLDIEKASYHGTFDFNGFQLGNFLERSDLGMISSFIFVDGKGFTENSIDLNLKGNINQIFYNQYNYTRIKLNGNIKKPIYKGDIYVNDPNLFMDFKGVVDVSDIQKKYDIGVFVDYADLGRLNFMKDSISIFKGNIKTSLKGNSINEMVGEIAVINTSYQNERDIFLFDDLKITSSLSIENVRNLTINSPDVITGRMEGKYDFDALLAILENGLGSIYSNYKPNLIKSGQYLNFNFSIYNKIIDIFFPKINIGSNTVLNGYMNGDTNELKVNLKAPKMIIYDNEMHKISLSIDSKNPLLTTYLEIDSVRNGFYKIVDFNLININARDTLFFKTEFKGGGETSKRDDFKLNLFHTIDENKNSNIGFQKSFINFKDYEWLINPNEAQNNKIIVDKKMTNIVFDNLNISHQEQNIQLDGFIKENGFKDINLKFKEVDISKITPSINNFEWSGNLNGAISLVQNNLVYQPTSNLTIDHLEVNGTALGDLNFEIIGNNSFSGFSVDASLKNKGDESFSMLGSLSIQESKTFMDIDLRMADFNLIPFKDLGGDVISELRGFVSGTAAITGTIDNPIMNGRLFMNQTGLKIPYLNVDLEFDKNSIIDITEKQFVFNKINFKDTKYESLGELNGNIRHNGLTDWFLDLNITADRLLVLDTKDSEESLYYGTAFIEGKASLSGATDELLIDVNATSKKGTTIKLPIGESETVGEKTYISFLSFDNKYGFNKDEKQALKSSGLEMKFDFKINQDAEIEVILDRESGHGMKGIGEGNIMMNINTNGKFNMYGDYEISKGVYNFKYRMFDKVFNVDKGNIVWDGDPLRARLNLEAKYRTMSNPAVLLENPSFNRKVQTEVIIGINGTILNPLFDVFFDFPTISSVFKSEIQSRLDNSEIRQTQALSVLGTGNFISLDGNMGQNALTNNLYETLGGVLDNIFKDEDGKIKVGVDVVTADRTPGREADGSVGVTTSFNINERISVNGKVGVPVGGLNQSSIVGNVEILYRLNQSGTSNLRAFNRENDINYIGEGIGFTQGLGISYEINFSSFNELYEKLFKNKAKKVDDESKSNDQLPDSDYSLEYMKFIESRNKKKTDQKEPSDIERVPGIE